MTSLGYLCMCQKPPHLPRFQLIGIEALSIRKNFDHQSGIDVEEKILSRVENQIFTGEEFESR